AALLQECLLQRLKLAIEQGGRYCDESEDAVGGDVGIGGRSGRFGHGGLRVGTLAPPSPTRLPHRRWSGGAQSALRVAGLNGPTAVKLDLAGNPHSPDATLPDS